MRNNSKLSLSEFVVQEGVKILSEESFGPRREFNLENAQLISNDQWFLKQLTEVRKKYKIPKLKASSDLKEIEYHDFFDDQGVDVIDAESKWLNNQNKEVQDQINGWIRLILGYYSLPQNWDIWIEGYLFYGKPKYVPKYNWELTYDVIDDPERIMSIGLTTQEKDFVKDQVRKKLGIKGKPNRKLQKIYREFLERLSLIKNFRRRSPTLTDTIKVVRKHKKEIEVFNDENEWINMRNTYKSIIASGADIDEKKEKKSVNKIKKRAQRLKQKISPSLK